MDYQEFRDLCHNVLRRARLQIPHPISLTERINLRDMSRAYEVALCDSSQPKCEPFYLVTVIL